MDKDRKKKSYKYDYSLGGRNVGSAQCVMSVSLFSSWANDTMCRAVCKEPLGFDIFLLCERNSQGFQCRSDVNTAGVQATCFCAFRTHRGFVSWRPVAFDSGPAWSCSTSGISGANRKCPHPLTVSHSKSLISDRGNSNNTKNKAEQKEYNCDIIPHF